MPSISSRCIGRPQWEGIGWLTLAEVVVGEESQSLRTGRDVLRVELPGGASLEVRDRSQLALAVELLRALRA